MEGSRRKIAFFSINDPLDKRSWSGTTYYLGQTLQRNIGDVHFLGPVPIPRLLDKTMRGIAKATRILLRTEWIPKYSLLKNIYAALWLKRRMRGHRYDFLIAPAAASELAYLNTRLPIVYFGDATYKSYSETYAREFKDLNPFSRWEGNHLEGKSLRKSSLIVFSSRWAAASAARDYGIPESKIRVLPLGANIDVVPQREVIFKKEENHTLTLLFLAVDWERKGGAIAFDTLVHLHQRGVEAKLIVCGCVPPPSFTHSHLEVIPFLNKNEMEDYNRFVQILSSVHFLILPTRADCSLLVGCESSAYGVPSITTNVGGVPEIVKDGVNGYCLPPEAGGADYAAVIARVYNNKDQYHQLINSSRTRFEQELNWDKWAGHFQKMLEEFKL